MMFRLTARQLVLNMLSGLGNVNPPLNFQIIQIRIEDSFNQIMFVNFLGNSLFRLDQIAGLIVF